MSNLSKKVTSSVAALAVVFSIVSPIAGANAAYTSSIDAANKLATLGVVADKSANPADYRLGDNITRREAVKVAMQLAACQDVTLNSAFAGKFSDVPSSDWAWKYAETAVDNGFISANAMFYPSRNVSKGEALKMIMNATQVAKSDAGVSFWADYVAGGVSAAIVEDFSDYNTEAPRGWIFKVAANAVDGGSCGTDDGLDGLIDDLDGTGTTDTGTTVDPVTTGGTFTVALSSDTPAAATIPAGVSGLPVAVYDFTAGESDVTVTSVSVKRKGISDKETLTSLAAFTSDGRASKGKDDSQNDNTEALLTLTNGFVIKAGETRSLTIVADVQTIATAPAVEADEFAIELVEIVASATAQSDGSLVGNTMRIGSRDAAKIFVQSNGSVSDPKLGDEGVDLFKFQIKGANEEDVVVKAITFRADNGNAEEDLENFKVYMGSTEVAATAKMNDKYVTFTFGNGLTIAKNKTEKFTVKGDVIAGAADTISFYVDKALDVTANGTKYGYGAAVDIVGADTPVADLGDIKIQAGELTLVDIDAPSDKIREGKDDVVLGTIKVTNVAGKNLELQQFGVLAALTPGASFKNDLNNDNVANDVGNAALDLDSMLENVELYNVDSGASYELDRVGSVYQDTDIAISLAQGTSTFQIRADVKDNIGNFNLTNIALSLDSSLTGNVDANLTNGAFLVQETEDDTVVTDITPSSLSWRQIAGTEAGAQLTVTPLSDLTKVRGANDVVALQFEIEADDSSMVNIDELKATVMSLNNTALATNAQISQVALYKGTVSDANLLDRVSGSNLAAGVATFDGFNVAIAANAKQTFVITLSFVDGANTTLNDPYTVRIVNAAAISAQDDDNDDIVVGGTYPAISARDVTVNDYGVLTATADANNTDNKDDKTVLAGTSKTVFSADVQSTNESVDVETATFTVSQDLRTAVVNASLYLGDTLIATNSNADITATTITFKNLTTLIIPQETKELRLALNTATIGFERVGQTIINGTVTNVALTDADGVDSGKVVLPATLGTTSKNFSIVPGVLVASVTKTLSNGTAEIKFTLDTGDNKVALSNNKPNAELTSVVLTQLAAVNPFSIYNVDNVSGKQATFAALSQADRTISDTETYVLVPTITTPAGTTYTTKIGKADIIYAVDGNAGLNMNMTAELDLGTKTY